MTEEQRLRGRPPRIPIHEHFYGQTFHVIGRVATDVVRPVGADGRKSGLIGVGFRDTLPSSELDVKSSLLDVRLSRGPIELIFGSGKAIRGI
jgi:hypothetical protein